MKVFICRRLPEEGLKELTEKCAVEINPYERALTPEELKDYIVDKEAILSVGDRIDAKIIDAAPRLKIISNYGVGYDNIDIEYAAKKGVIVTNLPTAVTQSTAEMTWALILAVARRITEADRLVRASESFLSSPTLLMGTHLFGKRLGIIGFGRIGQEVARRAIPFGMEVVYYDQRRQPAAETSIPATYVDFLDLLSTADVITLHVPLTPETRHLIAEKEFEVMKQSAIIINIARGPVIKENALIAALQSGRIKGAGLDVFEKEPFVPQELRKMNNVVLTPHLGTSTYETRVQMALMAGRNIIDVMNGKKPVNTVNL